MSLVGSAAPLTGANVTLAQLVALRTRANQWRRFGQRHSTSTGARRGSRHGRGMEFEELRAYDAGDDVRDIDWRVTARTGAPHTKTYREERERPTSLIVDLRSSMAFGSRLRFKNVAAAELAAAIAWGALADADRVGGLLLQDDGLQDIPARRNDAAVLRLLGGVAAATLTARARLTQPTAPAAPSNEVARVRLGQSEPTSPASGLAQTFDALVARTRPGERLVVISDFHDAPALATAPLIALARKVDLHCVLVYDPLDAELPPAGHYPVAARPSGLLRWLDSGARRVRDEHRARFAARRQWLASLARRAAVRVDELCVDQAIDALAPRAAATRRGTSP